MVNAQDWLASYALETRRNISELDIKDKNLNGELVINGEEWPNLESINVENNKLNSLIINNCQRLNHLDCSKNQLVNLNIDNCPQLTQLWASNNKFSDLTVFSNLINLQYLDISNNKISSNSLEPLKNLTELGELYIQDTDIAIELQYSLESLEKIYCCPEQFPEPEKYEKFEEQKYFYDYRFWRENQIKDQQIILLQEELINFSEQKQQINYLEIRIQELVKIIKTQKEKIINTFLRLFPEKELLQELIKEYLEFIKFKKQYLGTIDYRKNLKIYEKKYQEIEDELEGKLDESVMNEIQIILVGCEDLIRDELELEERLKTKTSLIESQQQNHLLQKTDEKLIAQITQLKRELEEKEKINYRQWQEFHLQHENSLVTKITEVMDKKMNINKGSLTILIGYLNTDQQLIQKNPNILTKINELLGIKKIFLNYRRQTITKLQDTCDLLEEANVGKYAKIEDVSKALAAVGKLLNNLTPLNIIEPIGDGLGIVGSIKKRKFAVKNSQTFKEFFTQEENDLDKFKEVHSSLMDSLPNIDIRKEELPNLFDNRHRVYEIATNIWQGKVHIESSDMKEAISLLKANLLILQDELEQQEQTMIKLNQKFLENFRTEQQDLQVQIQITPKNN